MPRIWIAGPILDLATAADPKRALHVAAAAARDQDQLEEEKEDEGGLNRFQQAPPLWRGSWMRTGTETGQSGLVMGRSYKNRLS